MKRIIFYIGLVVLFLSLAESVFGIDEDAYVRFATDSVIALHKFKGNPRAMELWAEEIGKSHPDYMDKDFQAFEEDLKKNNALKDRIYNRILGEVRSRGYNARITDLGGGKTTIEIVD